MPSVQGAAPAPREQRLRVRAADGAEADLHLLLPEAPGGHLLYWLPALGVTARQYVPFAQALAGEGIAVALHEWRGAGSSSLRASRRVDWGYRELLRLDLPAGFAAVRSHCGDVRTVLGGHSLGGQIAVLESSLQPQAFAGLVLLASGSPWWRCFPRPRLLQAACVAVPSLCYQNSGWIQFGYRFSNDFAPFLIAMIATSGRRLSAPFWLLAAWSVAVNAFGAVTFQRTGYERYYFVDGTQRVYANLDYAASAPALQAVADRVAEVLPLYASVHRGAGYLSQVSTALYESARQTIARFVDAREDDVAIITRNTTDSLNLLAGVVPAGERVLVLDLEHHANLLPWLRSSDPQGRRTTILPIAETVAATLESLRTELAARPYALVTVSGASNVTGEALPVEQVVEIAHAAGARVAVDGAQLVPHRGFSLARSGADYVVFSGHKIYAPFGAGVLVGRADWLQQAQPYLVGGGATSKVTDHGDRLGVAWSAVPERHEAGSPNVVGVISWRCMNSSMLCRNTASHMQPEIELQAATGQPGLLLAKSNSADFCGFR